jgi:two-component system NarL family sensor kinase
MTPVWRQSAPLRLAVLWTAIGLALLGAAVVLALRTMNTGQEPLGRDWWIVADTLLGLTYLPLGAAIALRGRTLLGVAFCVVGVGAMFSAIVAEWHAHGSYPSTLPVIDHFNLARAVGLTTLAVVVPWLLPWPRAPRRDVLTGWLALGVLISGLGVVVALFERIGDLPGAHVAGPLLLVATVPLVGAGAFVAVIRTEHGSLGEVSHRSLMWVIFASGVVLLYTVLVAGFGLLLGANGPAWLLIGVTGALAVAAEPARSRVRRFVDRLVYGQRHEPLEVVRQLVNQHVAAGADETATLLPSLAMTLANVLRLDHVAIDLHATSGRRWVRAAQVGERTERDEEFPLALGGEPVGRLVAGCRDAPLGKRYRDVLADLAPHVTVAVAVVRLTAELRRSQRDVLAAREEERRRLRRDLHDGLGPSLTGISMGLHTLVRRLDRTGTATDDLPLLTRLADEVDRSADEVKRIVRDLRPTALDDHGLSGALTEFVRSLDGVLAVELDLPVGGCHLPAAIETAMYRIATEALNNVVRHAAATRCAVSLVVTDHVALDITDDGVGLPRPHGVGVGLSTMRDRAAELGGSAEFSRVHPHGTNVHAELPLAVTA